MGAFFALYNVVKCEIKKGENMAHQLSAVKHASGILKEFKFTAPPIQPIVVSIKFNTQKY